MQTTREGVIKPVHCYVHQTNYPIILCNIRLRGIAVNRWRSVSNGNPENFFFRQGRDIGHEVTVDRVMQGVYPAQARP